MYTWNATGFVKAGVLTAAALVATVGIWGTQAELTGAVVAPGVIEVDGRN